jgi:AcrR family transcriptional regulator
MPAPTRSPRRTAASGRHIADRRPGRPPGPDPRRPERLEQILAAACRAILERGFPATRIADIARAAGVSTGTVHYYFATKDEVLVAALKWASARLFARVERAADETATQRLARLLAVSVPHPGPARDEYVLWIELWLRVLHQPELLPECEAISARWRGYFHAVVRDGAAAGEFAPATDPDEVAERLVAFVDGLGFETALGYSWTSPGRMHARVVELAAEQLGLDPVALARTDPEDRR